MILEPQNKKASNDLKKSVIYPLYLGTKEIIRHYNMLLSKYDVTFTQYVVLMYFYHMKTSNLKNVGKAMLLDSSTLTPLLKKLEKKGFLVREKSSTDERNLQISITEKGLALKPKLKKVSTEMLELCDLTPEELETLHKIMLKLLVNMREENENGNGKRNKR